MIDANQLKNLRRVSCDDGVRDERVVQWADTEAGCIQLIDAVYHMADGVVLCTVGDYA